MFNCDLFRVPQLLLFIQCWHLTAFEEFLGRENYIDPVQYRMASNNILPCFQP